MPFYSLWIIFHRLSTPGNLFLESSWIWVKLLTWSVMIYSLQNSIDMEWRIQPWIGFGIISVCVHELFFFENNKDFVWCSSGINPGSFINLNDMAVSCTNLLPVLFADDTNLLASHEDFNSLMKNVNDELSTIEKWSQLNKLTLNVKKCNFMIFCNTILKRKLKSILTALKLNSFNKPGSKVIIDSGLKWSNHIDLVSKRSPKLLGILRKVWHLIHSSSHLALYYGFLFPCINYCNIFWAATYPTYLRKNTNHTEYIS